MCYAFLHCINTKGAWSRSLLKNVYKATNWKLNAMFSCSETPFIWPIITGNFSLATWPKEHPGFCRIVVHLILHPHFVSVTHSIIPRLLLMPNSPHSNIHLSLAPSFELSPRNTFEYLQMIHCSHEGPLLAAQSAMTFGFYLRVHLP